MAAGLAGACATDSLRAVDAADEDAGASGAVPCPDAVPVEPDLGAGGAPDPVATTEWTDSARLVLPITDHADLGPYRFGLWDCIPGEQDGYDLCHHVPANGVLTLRSVHPDEGGTIDELMEDETTLMNGPRQFGLTHILIRWADDSDCWTWGHSPQHYIDALGCSATERSRDLRRRDLNSPADCP